MIGKVIINENGEKAISFDDAAWAALPVGATICAPGVTNAPFKPCGRTVGHGSSCEMGWLCEGCEKRLAQSRLIAGFEAEIERLRTDLATLEQVCKEALPGVYYMDPPDGGDVSLGEQVLRMGKDAERYRKWRHGATRHCVETAKALCRAVTSAQIDEAIDALNWEG